MLCADLTAGWERCCTSARLLIREKKNCGMSRRGVCKLAKLGKLARVEDQGRHKAARNARRPGVAIRARWASTDTRQIACQEGGLVGKCCIRDTEPPLVGQEVEFRLFSPKHSWSEAGTDRMMGKNQ